VQGHLDVLAEEGRAQCQDGLWTVL